MPLLRRMKTPLPQPETEHAPPRAWPLRQAARRVRRGGLIAYPTEAVYGLGCDPLDGDAVARLLALKKRPVEKGLILIGADFGQLRPFVRPLSPELMAPVRDSWPGPHTWILPAAEGVPRWLTGDHDGLAVRVPGHSLARALCRACGSPLVSTSANPSQRPPARSALGVRRMFPPRRGQDATIDLILHGPVGGLPRATPIRDARSGTLIRP